MATNVVILTGNLTKDCEKKIMGDKTVLGFTLAVSEKYKDREDTSFFNCSLWTNGAIDKYLLKGTKILLQGRIKISNVNDRYFTNVIADRVELLGVPKTKEETKNQGDDLPF